MKKNIYLLYNSSDSSHADTIKALLTDADYSVTDKCLSESEVYPYIKDIGPDSCQLFISVNAIGFAQIALDGGSIYNRTPINTLAVIFDKIENNSGYLSQRINYTTHFLVSASSDVDYIHTNHPHIYHVQSMDDISYLINYLDGVMDWRF